MKGQGWEINDDTEVKRRGDTQKSKRLDRKSEENRESSQKIDMTMQIQNVPRQNIQRYKMSQEEKTRLYRTVVELKPRNA